MKHRAEKRVQSGVSLIELMIALLIGTLLILGAIQVFAASRSAYMISEGIARVQENGRFALDFLQRDIRMAGHMGCVNDQAHFQNNPVGLQTTFLPTPAPELNFGVSIQGYEATGTAPAAATTLTISTTPTTGGVNYSPALPTSIAAATSNRVDGSDMLALRFLAPEGVPVTNITGTAAEPIFHFDAAHWDVLRSGTTSPGLFGVADCLGVTIFQASAVDSTNGTVTFGGAPNNAVPAQFAQVFTPGQVMIFRAESVVYYVGLNADTNNTALYRTRFHATPNGALTPDVQELVEGVENMQLIYGADRELSATVAPSGYIDRQLIASATELGVQETGWRRVGSVQVALLASSPGPATAMQPDDEATLMGGGVTFDTPDDGRYRAVYQSTIALRNRLYGN